MVQLHEKMSEGIIKIVAEAEKTEARCCGIWNTIIRILKKIG